MIGWLQTVEYGGLNTLEWCGIAALLLTILLLLAFLIKRTMNLSISVEVKRNDGTPPHYPLPRGREKILVMDDDKLLQESLTQLLSDLGYQVICTSNGEETVSYMRKNGADLIVLDHALPDGMNGLEAYQAIRAFRPFQRAVMLSGYASPEQVKAIRELGVESYLVKPVTLPLLATAIRAELDRP